MKGTQISRKFSLKLASGIPSYEGLKGLVVIMKYLQLCFRPRFEHGNDLCT